jgi:hypothetical protein
MNRIAESIVTGFGDTSEVSITVLAPIHWAAKRTSSGAQQSKTVRVIFFVTN